MKRRKRRRSWVSAACVACALEAAAPPANASSADRSRPIGVGADLAYALPGGNLEEGSLLSDVTLGLVRLELDGAYRWQRRFSAGLGFGYGLVLPTICGSSSDCTSSLGSDVTVNLLGRWHIGVWKSFEPDVDLDLGYEWFSSKHSDSGVTSFRSFHGIFAGVGGHAQFRLTRALSVGPVIEVSAGSFAHASLEAPGVDVSRDTDGTAVHVWTSLGARALTTW
ncbi:MAG TPA: hypothetical protein VF103_03050 [Polyangiaceae bacterium]